METLPGHEAAILTCKEDKTGRNLRWLTSTTHRGATKTILGIVVHS